MKTIWSSNTRLCFRSRFSLKNVKYNNKRNFTNSTTTAVTDYYDNLTKENKIKDDSNQRMALGYLDRLHADCMIYDEKLKSNTNIYKSENKQLEDKTNDVSSWSLSSLFGSDDKEKKNNKAEDNLVLNINKDVPKSLYLYGGPGSGKTFTMELFFDTLNVKQKKRVHFNEFMLQVHRMLFSLRKQGVQSEEMIEQCVDGLYDEAWMLCFDEFQVTDIADAMILRQLFHALLRKGMVMVITSNRAPDELYKNGIQRDLFLPCIDDINNLFNVVDVQSQIDYRMLSLEKLQTKINNKIDTDIGSVYFVQSGHGVKQTAMFERLYKKFTKNDIVYDSCLKVQGRTIHVPEAAKNDDIARFTFDDLCGQARGAADYYAIASNFHTIFIDHVPQLKLSALNQLRRFITMIDTFYDQKVIVVISAETEMDDIFDSQGIENEEDVNKIVLQDADIIGDDKLNPTFSNIDEVFAFARTKSRLHEMNRADYLLHARKANEKKETSPVRFLSQFEVSSRQDKIKMSSNDIKMLWDRYDKDKNGKIDSEELEKLLEDMTLFNSGHRHVPKQVFIQTNEALMNQEGQNIIDFTSFKKYFENYGLSMKDQ